MSWLSRFRLPEPVWDIDAVLPPWGKRPSIHAFLQGLPPGTDPNGPELPDEAIVRKAAGFGWAPGALDGAFGHHGTAGQDAETPEKLVAALQDLLADASEATVTAFYPLLKGSSVMDYIDPFLEAVVARDDWDPERLHRVAEWLVRRAPDREAVKAGIAILGLFQGTKDRELLLEIGRHEEFTLFAIVALQNTADDWEMALWSLGREVRGWGRIHIIERLADTTNEHIQGWMLRDGANNDILPEYTALICARSGRLAEALALPEPDDALIAGAGVILSALLATRGGSPADGMEAFEDGPRALEGYLRVLAGRRLSMEQFMLLRRIADFLQDDDAELGSGGERWAAARTTLVARVEELLGQEDWPVRVRDAVEAEGEDFAAAAEAAHMLGVDIWDVHFRRLLRGENEWYQVMQTDDRERAERVVAYAESTLPLHDIAVGPAEELGLGPGFAAHGALDFVLQDLGRFPGLGWPLIHAGLKSPVTRNRNMAAKALGKWPADAWPADAMATLRVAIANEPVDDTWALMQKVLRGEDTA